MNLLDKPTTLELAAPLVKVDAKFAPRREEGEAPRPKVLNRIFAPVSILCGSVSVTAPLCAEPVVAFART